MIPSGMMRIQGVPICFESNSSVFHSLTVHFLVGQKNDEKFSLPYVTIVRFHSFVVQGHAKQFNKVFENLLKCPTVPATKNYNFANLS